MSRGRYSAEAQRDLQGIHDYIAADNPTAALGFIERIERTCDLIAGQPDIGERCESLLPGMRLFTLGNYLIFYRSSPNEVEIVRVIHGARDWRRII